MPSSIVKSNRTKAKSQKFQKETTENFKKQGLSANKTKLQVLKEKKKRAHTKHCTYSVLNSNSTNDIMLSIWVVYAYTAQITYTTKRKIPISLVAETSPNGPSTITGKVHKKNIGFVRPSSFKESFKITKQAVHLIKG
ncbi:hypothetical protein ACJW31_09G168000 [Castanea mollissima]